MGKGLTGVKVKERVKGYTSGTSPTFPVTVPRAGGLPKRIWLLKEHRKRVILHFEPFPFSFFSNLW